MADKPIKQAEAKALKAEAPAVEAAPAKVEKAEAETVEGDGGGIHAHLAGART